MAWISSYIKRLCILIVVFAMVGTASLWMMGASTWMGGWLWGACGSIVYVGLLALHVVKTVALGPDAGRTYLKRTAVIRLLVAIFFMLVAVQVTGMEAMATGVGLLLYRLAMVCDYFLVRRWIVTDDYYS